MAYITKTEGTYSFLDLPPSDTNDKWEWIFFHPNGKPTHEHVALHLKSETLHFGIDKAGQLMRTSWAKGDDLDAIRFKEIGDKVHLIIEYGEVGSESDGWGSYTSQSWHTFSKIEYQNMKDEFNSGMQKMGWKR